VQIPPQQARGGVVILQVIENKVGRLRVHGSRYFSLEQIKKGAPSLVEGKVVNFEDVTRDIIALNQLPDRRVTPSLRAGIEPNTVDVDLTVKDTLPLHGSIELNNRYSADTTELRLNGSVSYNNLWQLGHSAGLSFQIAPQSLEEVKVLSGFYTIRVPSLPWINLMLQGTKQDSNVSTLGGPTALGGSAVAGRGEVIGERLNITLPAGTNFYHFFSFGLDYKHFDQNIVLGSGTIQSPITYYPISAAYGATWAGKGGTTEFNSDLTFHIRGMGSDQGAYDNRRFNSDGSFIYLRSDLSHTHELPFGFQAFGKVQGQISNAPLVDSEQFSGGGLGTARGYLESTALGDNALFGTAELRTPSLFGKLGENNEWRLYVFCDAGALTLKNPLPEQQSHFSLASIGVGTRVRLMEHLNGSLDAGLPLIQQSSTSANDLLLTFRVWAEF
jgi:hemolysin activation/secretion protein